MRIRLLVTAIVALIAATALGQPVPKPGQIVDGIPTRSAPSQTYAVYLPTSHDPARRAPGLLIFDPRKRGAEAAEIFRPAAERFGWVLLSSNETESDGQNDSNFSAVNALIPEVSRYAIDGSRVYVAGFSGGGILAMIVASSARAIGGVIQCGGRLQDGLAVRPPNYPHWGAAGRADFNFVEMHEVDTFIAEAGQPYRLEIFGGTHEWISQELATRALAWQEIEAMRKGLRVRDASIVDFLYQDDLRVAARLRAETRLVELLEHCESMERTYAGLREAPELRLLVESVRSDGGLRAAQREARKALGYEQSGLRALGKATSLLRTSEIPPSSRTLAGQLGLTALLETSRGNGALAEAARRVLASVYAQMAFYLPRDAIRSGDAARAARALEVAVQVRPDSAVAHYNLACARMRSGSKDAALASLDRAVECGFRDTNLIETDDDLAPLRGDERFKAIVEELKQSP